MPLNLMLSEDGFTPDALEISSTVTIDADKYELTGSHLTLKAEIPNIDKNEYAERANNARDNCPVSKALSLKITLDTELG